MRSFKHFFSSPFLFFGILLVYLLVYVYFNIAADIGVLSSDVWGYQFLELQERYEFWSNVPSSYNQSEYYLGFPLFYYLNPGLEFGLAGYHILAVVTIVLTYVVTGLITYRLVKSWPLASLAGLLVLIPRFIFPTRIGLLDLSLLRGNVLASPFYVLLSYYWIIFGLNSRWQNITLATIGGLLVYIYPPAGIISLGIFILTGLILRGRECWPRLLSFVAVYFLISAPFWANHFSNTQTSMLDPGQILTPVQIAEQLEIIKLKFSGGFLASAWSGGDFADIKRSLWDESLLLLISIWTAGWVWRRGGDLPPKLKLISLVSVTTVLLTILMIISVEVLNYWSIRNGGLPMFVDHLRPMRAVGFVLMIQSVFGLYLIGRFLKHSWLAIVLAGLLVITPLRFSAPLVRLVVRATIPESIRVQYNLAPVVIDAGQRLFTNLQSAAWWARLNLDPEQTKFFVFDDFQNDFRFKVLSRLDTNLTGKEGNLWVTTGYQNSMRWYRERQNYELVTKTAKSFSEIFSLARELNSTHMLIPRGRYWDLFERSDEPLEILYQNSDYKIIKL